jgi:putative thioredoxin
MQLPPQAFSFDVTEADFEAAVLERSMQVPVLLDCWAPWCGPCRSLGPVLEKLAQAYGGRFVLAKLNTDEAPQISAALQIRSIPLVVLFCRRPAGGPVHRRAARRPDPRFPGQAPQAAGVAGGPVARRSRHRTRRRQCRSPAARSAGHATRPWRSHAGPGRAADRPRAAHAEAHVPCWKALPAEAPGPPLRSADGRGELAANRPEGDPVALAARIAANPKDFDARFALAAIQAFEGDFTAAFDSCWKW